MAKLSYNSANRSIAKINYTCAGDFSKPSGSSSSNTTNSGDDKNGSRTTTTTTISYGDITYSWTGLSNASGVSGVSQEAMSAGGSETFQATVTASVKKTITVSSTTTSWTTTGGGTGEDGKPIPEKKNTTTSSSGPTSSSEDMPLGSKTTNSLTVYAQPAAFTWRYSSITPGGYISVSARDWNNLCDTIALYLRWQSQQDKYNYSGAKVSGGEDIGWKKYNMLAKDMGISTVDNKTYIKSSHFSIFSTKLA